VDEVTKLRNRIAELESLVRELRGKPHPRWVDNNANNSSAGGDDISEKWHTRAFKKSAGAGSQQLTIKTEEHSSDYLSPHRRPGMYSHPSNDGHFSPSPPLSVDASSAGSSSSPPRGDADPSYYTLHSTSTPTTTTGMSCRCLSNPSVTSQLSSLTRALHSAHGFLNRSAEHNTEGCVVIDRIADLNNLLLPSDSYNNTFVGNGSHHLPPHPNQQFSPLPSPHTQEFDPYVHQSPHQYSSTTRTPESEIAPDNTSSTSGSTFAHTPHQIPSQWYQPVPSPTGPGAVNTVMHSGYNPYFPNSPAIGDVQQQAAGQTSDYML
jgi:hypothetical protein